MYNFVFAEWLTGFLEGDGSVCVQHVQDVNCVRELARIEFSQSELSPLEFIGGMVKGGRLYPNEGKTVVSEGTGKRYESAASGKLTFSGKKCIELLGLVSSHVVSSYYCERLNVVLGMLGLETTVTHGPTMCWVVGFWDAEGTSRSSDLYESFEVRLKQSRDEVLYSVLGFLGIGRVYQSRNWNARAIYEWVVGGRKSLDLAGFLLEHSKCPNKRERLRDNYSRYVDGLRTREYMRAHPEEVERLRLKVGGSL